MPGSVVCSRSRRTAPASRKIRALFLVCSAPHRPPPLGTQPSHQEPGARLWSGYRFSQLKNAPSPGVPCPLCKPFSQENAKAPRCTSSPGTSLSFWFPILTELALSHQRWIKDLLAQAQLGVAAAMCLRVAKQSKEQTQASLG